MVRALSWSECTPGSASACSSSACSLTRSAIRSNTSCLSLLRGCAVFAGCPRARRACNEPRSRGLDLGSAGLLAAGLLAGSLPEALLEPGHATAGVQDLLLARVERVAVRADLDVDRAAAGGALGGKAVPAATGHVGDVVLRVDVWLHDNSCLERSPGRLPSGRDVNRYHMVA